MNADTPMSGHIELQELAQRRDGLKFSERIVAKLTLAAC